MDRQYFGSLSSLDYPNKELLMIEIAASDA